MATVGIIAEYNPFHLGHEYQINKIREEFGSDTTIVAVMSGNFTQRGDVAIFDKLTRARAAVDCGVNLVLELPFPHSLSSAEFFAFGGVYILNALGVVDYLSFGSECGDIELLSRAAVLLKNEKEDFRETHNSEGYAVKCEKLCSELLLKEQSLFSSNNILGIEYIKALCKLESKIIPTTIKRVGSAYNSLDLSEEGFKSAMAIRALMKKNDMSALDFVPKAAKSVFSEALSKNKAPCLAARLDAAVISSFRLNTPKATGKEIHDAEGGLYNRIRSASFDADSISSLIELAKTKKYTTARIRRAMWYSIFGVTSSEVKAAPTYTQMLAADEKGTALLKRIKKMSDFPILTKPTAKDRLCSEGRLAKELSDKADSLFRLTKPLSAEGDFGKTFTPYVKKGDITL